MNIVQLLPEKVVSQIAAGEVVQRPASVIKELMENSIDAGASSIDVLVEDAGRSLIQVIDNGKGMSPDDATLAFKHHATSKIRNAEDLFTLHTMGFRGEALPSIAAVSQVALQTRTPDAELGTHIEIAASEITSQHTCVCKVGSNFAVRNLFYNIPARRKFLKSNTTEQNNIIQEFQRVALVNPSVEFSLTTDGTLQTRLAPSNTRRRIVDIFGRKTGEQLLQIEADTSLIRLTGYVGRPETSRKKGAHQYFFVNGRYMRHAYFNKAVQKAFEGLIPADEQIPYFIYFDVDPASVDVNISPTKTEVKFENEPSLWQIIIASIKESLGKYNVAPSISFDESQGIVDIPVFEKQAHVSAPQIHIDKNYNPFNASSRTSGYTPEYRSKTSVSDWQSLYEGLSDKVEEEPVREMLLPFEEQDASIDVTTGKILQYRGQYLMLTCEQGLMIINQRRAHTRILYDRYVEEAGRRKAVMQGLLFPELLQLSVADSQLMDTMMEYFQQLGFEIAPLGHGSYSINSVPTDIRGLDPKRLVCELIEEVRTDTHTSTQGYQTALALALARRASIADGQVLSADETQHLVGELFKSSNPNITPDGKKILTILKHEDITTMLD